MKSRLFVNLNSGWLPHTVLQSIYEQPVIQQLAEDIHPSEWLDERIGMFLQENWLSRYLAINLIHQLPSAAE